MNESNHEIIVQVGLFSGMPNPEIKLTGKTADEFVELLKTTREKAKAIHSPPPPRLGEFYGFFFQIPEEKAEQMGIPAKANIVHNVLTDMTKKKQAHWQDDDGVERFLIRIAYEQGIGELMQEFNIEEPQ